MTLEVVYPGGSGWTDSLQVEISFHITYQLALNSTILLTNSD